MKENFIKIELLIKSRDIIIVLLTITQIFIVLSVSASPKLRVAILNFKANNTATAYADVVRDILEVHLYKTNAYDIVERNQIDVILKEQGIEDKYCSDTGCAVRIGKILSVDTVVIGSVNRAGKFTITIKFVNVKEGIVEYADSEIADIESVIENAVNTLAKRSAERLMDGSQASRSRAGESNLADYYFRGIIPGWPQFYSGHNIKGYSFLGGFIMAGSFSIWAYFNYNGKKQHYRDAKLGTSKSEFNNLYNDYKTATYIGRASLGLAALVYISHWADVIFFSKPVPEENKGMINYGGSYYSLHINYNIPADDNIIILKAGTSF